MAAQGPFEMGGKCCSGSVSPQSILYQILNNEERWKTEGNPHCFPLPFPNIGCPCEVNRRVILKIPGVTCNRALEVLLKTITFIRKLPSFFQLPLEDQILLIRQGWAPLFLLGLAQERVDFELLETSVPSLLKAVLLNQSPAGEYKLENSPLGASLAEVQKIKDFLGKFWNADICAKEYAYLKGIVLFNPDLHDLKCHHYVQALQQEARHTLIEFVSMTHSRSRRRYAWMMESLGFLRTFSPDTIGELFFKPILGDVDLNTLLLETLYTKQDLI
ncbi:nuclear receptor subfamily 0 group B member 2-like isoform X1 [Podarcis muralis]